MLKEKITMRNELKKELKKPGMENQSLING